MKLIIPALLLLFLPADKIFPQEKTDHISAVTKAFNLFDYEEVIKRADAVLGHQDSIGTAQRIELLRMKAAAHYVLEQEDMAALAYVNILKTNPDYELDPVINSPKLINFFKKVQENFKPKPADFKLDVQDRQPVLKPADSRRQVSFWRSVLVPGWGHLHAGRKGKGALLMGASIAAMAGAAYLIAETAALEQEYLNKTVQAEIDKSYKEFNRHYRMRNGVLAAYALIWLYAQFDLPSSVGIGTSQTLSFHPVFSCSENHVSGLDLRISF